MPAKAITLGPLSFAKKSDAVAHLKAMLRKYELGDRVSVSDSEILNALIQQHPAAKTKIGCGITHFSVRTADFGTKCFWLNRIDGTTEKFSITGAIYGS